MTLGAQAIGIVTVMLLAVGALWALLTAPRGEGVREREPASHYWAVTYLEEDGTMVSTTVRLLTIEPQMRRIRAWCYASANERVLNTQKILQARDLNNGTEVDVLQFIQAESGAQSHYTNWRRLA